MDERYGVIPTGNYKVVLCSICSNLRSIAIMEIVDSTNVFRCNHIEIDYMDKIKIQDTMIKQVLKIHKEFVENDKDDNAIQCICDMVEVLE